MTNLCTFSEGFKMEIKNTYLHHTLATIAYRFQKTIHNAAPEFGEFSLGNDARNVNQIINHMFHVLRFTKVVMQTKHLPKKKLEPLEFIQEIERFNRELVEIDHVLSEQEIAWRGAQRLLQGPLADILTHIGQISMLRRQFGDPVPGENFSREAIKIGMLSYF